MLFRGPSLAPGEAPHLGGVAWVPADPGGLHLAPRAAVHRTTAAHRRRRLGTKFEVGSAQAQGGKKGRQHARGGAWGRGRWMVGWLVGGSWAGERWEEQGVEGAGSGGGGAGVGVGALQEMGHLQFTRRTGC